MINKIYIKSLSNYFQNILISQDNQSFKSAPTALLTWSPPPSHGADVHREHNRNAPLTLDIVKDRWLHVTFNYKCLLSDCLMYYIQLLKLPYDLFIQPTELREGLIRIWKSLD